MAEAAHKKSGTGKVEDCSQTSGEEDKIMGEDNDDFKRQQKNRHTELLFRVVL